MPFHHLLLALGVVFVWGTNFVVIKWGLAEFPPFLLAGLRFFFTAIPLVFVFPRPPVSWGRLAAFGVLLGAGQFGLLFLAMQHDISPGLASLVIQSQVFMTIAMAMGSSGERMRGLQVAAMAVAVAGVALIGWHSVGAGRSSVTPLGLLMVLAAAASWSAANMVARSAGRVNVIAFLAWSSPFSLPPLFALAAWQSGLGGLLHAVAQATWVGWSAVAWQTVGNTLFGYGAWNWLLARYPAATVTPTALLVPVFGMGASAWLLGESLPGWKLAAAALVMAGLALNVMASRVRRPGPP